VKLARWEDINYYGLKEISEKSHRKLAKLARDFETILKKPISQHLDELDLEKMDDTEPSAPSSVSTNAPTEVDPVKLRPYQDVSPSIFLQQVNQMSVEPINPKSLSSQLVRKAFAFDQPAFARNKLNKLVVKAKVSKRVCSPECFYQFSHHFHSKYVRATY